MQTNPAAEQSKIVRWSETPCNQSGNFLKDATYFLMPQSDTVRHR